MPQHWTYKDVPPNDSLRQGDIIRRCPELLAQLERIHPYFCDDKYIAFMLLTQSCDLVPRTAGLCRARQLTIAVIRELAGLLPGILNEICGHPQVPGILIKEKKQLAENLLARIIDQNEQSRGLFYLHPDADVGIGKPSVALLRVTIALRREHYNLLRDSRCGRLKEEYANKLGWLSGNLFSRVATPDWADQPGGKQAAQKLVRELLSIVDDRTWVPDSWIQLAQKKIDFTALDPSSARQELEKHAPKEPIEIVKDQVRRIARAVFVEEVVITRIAQRLRASDSFFQAVRDGLWQALAGVVADDQRTNLCSLLIQDDCFREAITNQVTSIIKTCSRRDVESFVESAALALAKTSTPPIRPILDEIVRLASEMRCHQPDIDSIRNRLTVNSFFTNSACDIIRGTGEQVLAESELRPDGPIDKLVKRIQNDKLVRLALRATNPSTILLDD